ALGASTLLLREVAIAEVVIGPKPGASGKSPALSAWLDTPGGIPIAPNGDIYIADSNNDVILRADPRAATPVPVAGIKGRTGFAGDDGIALKAQLDTPDGVCIAP